MRLCNQLSYCGYSYEIAKPACLCAAIFHAIETLIFPFISCVLSWYCFLKQGVLRSGYKNVFEDSFLQTKWQIMSKWERSDFNHLYFQAIRIACTSNSTCVQHARSFLKLNELKSVLGGRTLWLTGRGYSPTSSSNVREAEMAIAVSHIL